MGIVHELEPDLKADVGIVEQVRELEAYARSAAWSSGRINLNSSVPAPATGATGRVNRSRSR